MSFAVLIVTELAVTDGAVGPLPPHAAISITAAIGAAMPLNRITFLLTARWDDGRPPITKGERESMTPLEGAHRSFSCISVAYAAQPRCTGLHHPERERDCQA
jgi:hypothetical protein